MSMAAYAPKQTRGAHARPDTAIEIHVIPGGLLAGEPAPRHAEARLRDTLCGASYNLAPRERMLAVGAGIAFALASLAAVLV